MPQIKLSMKKKQTHRHREQTCGCQGGGALGEEWSGRLGIRSSKLLYRQWINNKVLLYSTGNYIQYPVINHMENEKECIYMYN